MNAQHSTARSIGARVRRARAAVGLTRRQLAARSDVSERYLSQLENGDANASIGVLGRVAQALGVDLVNLLSSSPTQIEAGQTPPTVHAPLAELVAGMSVREQTGAVAILERYLQDSRKALRGIALLGLRGAGKTTIGNLFAQRHRLPFLSVTREIEARAGMSLNDLFNLAGPEAYRTLENEVVKELSSRDDRIVLETAGGIVSNGSALDVIHAAFKTIWLKASPEEHLERVIAQGDMRPLQGTSKALEHLKSLLAMRENEYARADCVLDTSSRSPDACVDELEQLASAVIRP